MHIIAAFQPSVLLPLAGRLLPGRTGSLLSPASVHCSVRTIQSLNKQPCRPAPRWAAMLRAMPCGAVVRSSGAPPNLDSTEPVSR